MARQFSPKIYKDSPDKLVAASAGLVELQSGSTLDIQGTATVASGGDFAVEAGGKFRLPTEVGTSTATLSGIGLSLLNPTTSATYTLPAVTAAMYGSIKQVAKVQATTTITATVTQATTSLFFDNVNKRLLVMSAPFECVTLIASTEGVWRPIGGVLASTAAWSTA